MHRLTTMTAVLAAALLALPAAAQGQSVSVDARGGITVPTSDLSDFADPGPSVGVGLRVRAHRLVSVRVGGDLDVLRGKEVQGGAVTETPDMEMWRYGGGLEFHVPTPGTLELTVTSFAGGVAVNTDVFQDVVFDPVTDEPVGDFSETYFMASGGLRIEYALLPGVRAFADGRYQADFMDEEDTRIFTEMVPGTEPLEEVYSIPLTAGLRISF